MRDNAEDFKRTNDFYLQTKPKPVISPKIAKPKAGRYMRVLESVVADDSICEHSKKTDI